MTMTTTMMMMMMMMMMKMTKTTTFVSKSVKHVFGEVMPLTEIHLAVDEQRGND